VRQAHEAVTRIQKIDADIAAAEASLTDLAVSRAAAEGALAAAREQKAQADAALEEALAAAHAEGADPQMTDTVARQGLELRRAAAIQSGAAARQQIDAAT